MGVVMEKSVQNWSVIIVEDVKATRAVVRTLLREIGINDVHEAEDGNAALRILQSRRIDLVITDLAMTPMDGLELTRKIRQPHSKNAFVPVMMISGHDEEKNITDALDAGVSCFVKKPFAAGPFTSRVKSLLLHRRDGVKTPGYWGPDRRKREVCVQDDRRNDADVDLESL
jgi:CheY-like chemotaxis protein